MTDVSFCNFHGDILYDDILLCPLLTYVPSRGLAMGYPCGRMVGAWHENAFHSIVPFEGNPPMSRNEDSASFPILGIATFYSLFHDLETTRNVLNILNTFFDIDH